MFFPDMETCLVGCFDDGVMVRAKVSALEAFIIRNEMTFAW